MIVRDHGDAWQVVLQTDHAELSGGFARAWADRGPRHESLELAARRHDDGWAVWERSPLVDDAGAPLGFLDVHVPAHLAFYRAGIVAIGGEDPYAGLLVSMHAAGIYRHRYGTDTGHTPTRAAEVQSLVDAFVEEQESAFAARTAAAGIDEELRWADYHRLQLYDRLSLAFCLADWDRPEGAPFDVGEFHATPIGPWRARIEPYPFVEQSGRFVLARRLIPKRRWTQSDFRRRFFDEEPALVEIELVA